MNSGFVEASTNPAANLAPNLAHAAEDLAGLEPVKTIKSRWPMIIAGVLTVAMIVGLARQLLKSGLGGLSHATPDSWLYYVAFVLLYLSPPIGDYIIFRKLWRIPLEGLGALMKKRIANEVVLGYSGEAYFYAWARQRAQMVAAPFGAVKDVMILSAMAGNLMTLAMTALALPLVCRRIYVRPMLIGDGRRGGDEPALPDLLAARLLARPQDVVVGVRRAHGPARGGQPVHRLRLAFRAARHRDRRMAGPVGDADDGVAPAVHPEQGPGVLDRHDRAAGRE